MPITWKNIGRIDEPALQTFQLNYKELTVIIHKQEKQIQFLETKALLLSLFYIALQLVIFLSSSKPSAYQCRNWWKSFFVSLSIAVAFRLNFGTTVIKYVRTKYEQDPNFIDQEDNYHQMACPERNGAKHRESSDGSASMEIDFSEEYVQLKPDTFAVYKRNVHLGVTVFALSAFTALVLHTCRSSVCATDV